MGLSLYVGAVCAQQTEPEPEAAETVSEPAFEAVFYRVEVHAPKALRQTLEHGLDLVRWQDDPQMNAALLQRLMDEATQQCRRVAATEGYFSPKIETRLDRDQSPWLVTIDIEVGPRVTIENVDLQFSGPALGDPVATPLLNKVRKSWSLPAGRPFRQQDWDAAKRNALTSMSSGRYAAANIADSEARIDPATQRATLMVKIDSGPVFHFGSVEVVGAKRYPARIVENLSPLKYGDAYSADMLAVYQRRLTETGYFSSAQIAVDDDPAHADAASVRVSVIEARSQRVEAGLGFSTDTKYRGSLTYNNVDVLGSAWRFKTDLRIESLTQSIRADFDSPPHSDASWENAFSSFTRTDIENQETRAFAVGLAHNWGLERTPRSLYVTANLEEEIVNNEITSDQHAVFFGYRHTFSHTDDRISPRSGYLGTLTFGGAPGMISTRGFLRGTAKLYAFFPVTRNSDFELRGQAGAVLADTREGIPASFLFRTGGDQSVRGYGFESLGVDVDGAVVGGRYMALGSAEYTYWVQPGWGLATFIDVGDAADSRKDFDPAVGYGVGVRFRTPIGPLRADVAYGQQTNDIRLHFSVGYSF
jgi:translocation and assembly module TamA